MRAIAILRGVALAAFTLSALSQLYAGWRELRRPPDAHPEMPEEQRERALAVLRECVGRVGPRDLLAVSGGDEAADVFLRYRLAYLLYPAHVVEAGRTAESVAEAVGRPGAFARRYALVLGRPDLHLPGARVVRIMPADALLEMPAAP